MTMINFLELKEKFEIETYRSLKNKEKGAHIPFSGSPRKHPYSKNRVILVADPFTENTFYYEFRIQDIGCAEELPSITNIHKESVPMVRIWVKKHAVGIQCTPFIVDRIESPVSVNP